MSGSEWHPLALGQRLSPGTLFPLMTRELTEQSSRRRTYILRTIYAVALYGLTVWIFWNELHSWTSQSFSMLGSGHRLFESLAWLQFCGVYLFLPAMTSGLLTSEKERDTLSLLLLTRLDPWSILIGKLLSRLIPMASFMALSFPLLAVAYGLGGVNESDILAFAWTLSVTALQVGAFGLACSTWCRTTASSFVATYLLGTILIAGPPLLIEGLQIDLLGFREFMRLYLQNLGFAGNLPQFEVEEVGYIFFGPWACLHPNSMNQPFWNTVIRTTPMLMFAGACLVFSRVMLWRRAFVQPTNLLLKVFKSLDGLFHRLNQNRWTKGIVLTHENVALPLFEPIRWRETKKRSLGTTRYLIRTLLVLEIPVLFGMLIPYHSDYGHPPEYAPAFVSAYILWVITALIVSIQSCGLIGAERSRQTLDVLLTTPMMSETIVREKFSGVWRMVRVLMIPFATVYLFQIVWTMWIDPSAGDMTAFCVLRGILAMAIYPPLIAWTGFHFGMRCRSQTQAALLTLGIITGFCLIPIVIGVYVADQQHFFLQYLSWFRFFSPAAVLGVSVRPQYEYYGYWAGIDLSYTHEALWAGTIVHFLLAGILLLWLRWKGMKQFASQVYRNDGQIVDDDDIERLATLRQKIVSRGSFRASEDE